MSNRLPKSIIQLWTNILFVRNLWLRPSMQLLMHPSHVRCKRFMSCKRDGWRTWLNCKFSCISLMFYYDTNKYEKIVLYTMEFITILIWMKIVFFFPFMLSKNVIKLQIFLYVRNPLFKIKIIIMFENCTKIIKNVSFLINYFIFQKWNNIMFFIFIVKPQLSFLDLMETILILVIFLVQI